MQEKNTKIGEKLADVWDNCSSQKRKIRQVIQASTNDSTPLNKFHKNIRQILHLLFYSRDMTNIMENSWTSRTTTKRASFFITALLTYVAVVIPS